MLTRDFTKAATHLLHIINFAYCHILLHIINLLHIYKNNFLKEHLWWAASVLSNNRHVAATPYTRFD